MRNLRPAHADELLDLRDVRDRHDSSHNGNLDAHASGLLAPAIEVGVVEKKLRDDEPSAVVHLAFEGLQIARAIKALRMPFGISRDADAEIAAILDKCDELVGVAEAAFSGDEIHLSGLR